MSQDYPPAVARHLAAPTTRPVGAASSPGRSEAIGTGRPPEVHSQRAPLSRDVPPGRRPPNEGAGAQEKSTTR